MEFTDLCNYINACIRQINDMYGSVTQLFSKDPNTLFGSVITEFSLGVQTFAISLLSLFFIVGFLQKTLDFGWVKFENVLMFVAKITIVHAVVSQSDELMRLIFSSFNNLAEASAGTETFLNHDGHADFAHMILGDRYDALENEHGFWRSWIFLAEEFKLMPTFLILQLTMLLIVAMVIGRLIELAIMIIAAPLPLSGFASDATKDIAVGFLKKFVAVVMQTFILIIMFRVYGVAAGQAEIRGIVGGSLGMLLLTFVLALGVFKSGTWAKSLCGAV